MVTIRGQMEQFQSLALILGTSLNFFLFFFFITQFLGLNILPVKWKWLCCKVITVLRQLL